MNIIHVHSANTGVLDLFIYKIYGIRIRNFYIVTSTKYSESKKRSIRNYFFAISYNIFSKHLFCMWIQSC